jgi:hypothetical protein
MARAAQFGAHGLGGLAESAGLLRHDQTGLARVGLVAAQRQRQNEECAQQKCHPAQNST